MLGSKFPSAFKTSGCDAEDRCAVAASPAEKHISIGVDAHHAHEKTVQPAFEWPDEPFGLLRVSLSQQESVRLAD